MAEDELKTIWTDEMLRIRRRRAAIMAIVIAVLVVVFFANTYVKIYQNRLHAVEQKSGLEINEPATK